MTIPFEVVPRHSEKELKDKLLNLLASEPKINMEKGSASLITWKQLEPSYKLLENIINSKSEGNET